ncbi:MAG: sigma-70 family RNA polymerase sigma factor [Archangium sp.]|nr:sigma-70 family RNA polymerase sigma factor [Archangium sp.]
MNDADRQLVERARQGDREATAQVLRDYEQRIYRFGLRLCGDEDAAREVLQETLLAAFKGVTSFRGEAELSTWLYALARSFCLRSRRTPKTESLDTDELQRREDPAPTPDARAHAREIGVVLQAALGALSDDAREVVILKDVEGLTAEAIAGVLHEDVAAVKSRLHRARVQLRQHLSAVLEPQDAVVEACPEFALRLADFAAGEEVDQSMCLLIERHLAECPKCASACDSLRKTVSLCRHLPGGEVPPPIRAAVRRALGW